MIKECPVIINNDYLAVVKYDGTDVQIPPIKNNKKIIKIEYSGGVYKPVDDNCFVDTNEYFSNAIEKTDEENVSDNFEQSIEDQVYSVIAYEDNMKTIMDENVNNDDE